MLLLLLIIQSLSILYINFSDWLDVQQDRGLIRLVLQIPIVNWITRIEMGKFTSKYLKSLPKMHHDLMVELPQKGWNKKKIIDRLSEYDNWERSMLTSDKYSGVRFSKDKEVEEIAKEASSRFLYSNMIYPDLTTPSRYMEQELMNFVKGL